MAVILLDLDGTLADTIAAAKDAYLEFGAKHGFAPSLEEFEQLNGLNLKEIIDVLRKRHSIPVEESLLLAEYEELFRQAYATADPVEGADEFLRELAKRGHRLILVTSALQSLARIFIKRHGWEPLLTAEFCGDHGGKDNGNLHKRALAEAAPGVSSSIVAIEDSPAGIAAAKAAGVMAVGYAGDRDSHSLTEAGADMVATRLLDVLDLIDHQRNAVTIAVGEAEIFWEEPARRSGHIERAVDEAWSEALRERDLYDNPILNLTSWNDSNGRIELRGTFVRYREFIAQRRGAVALGITPLGVSGITILNERAVFGRRKGTLQYDGYLELVPSGSIDHEAARPDGTIDAVGQILQEFSAETGSPASAVTSTRCFALIYDPLERIYDVVVEVVVQINEEAFLERIAGSSEYEDATLVPVGQLVAFLDKNRDHLVPTTAAIIEAYVG